MAVVDSSPCWGLSFCTFKPDFYALTGALPVFHPVFHSNTERLLKVYLVSSRVGRVPDLCCDHSCRKTRTLRPAAFALQKRGDRALLGVPDGVITYRKENQELFSWLRTQQRVPLLLPSNSSLDYSDTVSDAPVELLPQTGCRAALKASSDVRLWTTSREPWVSAAHGRRPHWQEDDFAAEALRIVLRVAKHSRSSMTRRNTPEKRNSDLTQLLPASASEPKRPRAFLRPQEAFLLRRMSSRVPGGTAGPVSATKIGLSWNK